jgi:hypothetical protein
MHLSVSAALIFGLSALRSRFAGNRYVDNKGQAGAI